jgi:hypothetical protein
MDAWIHEEIDGCRFADARLGYRFGRILTNLATGLGKTLPLACQDWASTKAAYRFLDNSRVDENAILAGHFEATRSRFAHSDGLALVLHDTTEFSYQRTRQEAIGKTHKTFTGNAKDGRPRMQTVCGILMHSSLVVTTDGVPQGLAAVKFWTRKKFKGTNALKAKVNPTRMPIEEKESYRWIENVQQSLDLLGEPDRCVHVADREGDIFELFCAAQKSGTSFLIRTCVDRLAEEGDTTIAEQMAKTAVRGRHRVELRDKQGRPFAATLDLRYCRMTVRPPIGKQKCYPPLALTVIHAREPRCPKGRERLEWKLITNLPVRSLRDATEKLDWYALRWKIETYHKILKSGCKAEDAKLRTAQRLTNLIAIYCILSWRVFWLCMVNRASPDASAALVFTDTERRLLKHLVPMSLPRGKQPVSHYLTAVAKLGGYLARRRDPPPGNMVLWRGLSRLTDIHLGFTLGKIFVGN